MNTTVGKSFGLALLLAVGIIAVMVAMGTFSAQRAGADGASTDADATHTVMATDVVVKPANPQAGAGVELTINAGGGTAVTPLSEITVTLKNFGVPDDISEDEIVLRETGGGTNSANPDNVRVDGNTIVIEVPDMDGDGTGQDDLSRPFNILIRKRAGITTPTTAGVHHIKVEIEGADAVYQHLEITRTLSVDPKSGGGSTEVTVTGKALANGTATLYSDALILPDADEDGIVDVGATIEDPDWSRLKSVTVAGGTFETTVDAKDLMKAGDDGRSVITVSDSNGDEATVVFTVTGTTTLGSDSVGKGKSLEISIADWVEDAPDDVKIDGVSLEIQDEDGAALVVDVGDDNEATFYVTVSGDVGLGTKTVVLFAGNKRLDSASVEITAIDLTVSPSTATVGQEVTISGSGFKGNVESITVGDATVCDNTDGDTGNDCDIEVASGGRVISGFSIPNNADLADDGDYTITVTDSGGRIGSGTVTIPEPTLTVDPTESRFGSTINLSGAGWPTGTGANLVEILYEGIQYSTAITNSDGAWSDSISVPASAGVGQPHTVKAQATVGDEDDNVAQEADHSTPAAVVTLSSSQAQRGTNITVSGENFHVFETVMIEIGDSNVTPSPAPTTDGDGSFSTQVLVPGLALGNKNVRVTVKDVPVVEFLEVITTPVVMTVESVFGDLIDNGSLQTIWAYDFATGGWSSYTTDPETSFGNDLFELSSGDILYINVTGEQSFSHQKGNTLPDGWSLITLK